MEVLVTGATGYIGGRLIPRLLAEGHVVRAMTRDAGRLRDVPWAADVTVVVTDGGGRPVADAVVIADIAGQTASAPEQIVINQHDMVFAPFVTVVPVGSTVTFTNLDPFRHHVYSFSPARRFEIKLFGQGERRSVRFA
jgi:nucleoside-diphosphate-sugar epimerase